MLLILLELIFWKFSCGEHSASSVPSTADELRDWQGNWENRDSMMEYSGNFKMEFGFK